MKKMILSVISLFAAGSLAAQEASTATDQVPIEEYVPKVIIEGKWGTGPGEFGRQGDFDYDLKPGSLAVDSKGNIYILDFVNNRIQKYSGEGKHLLDIPIDGLKGPVQCWAVRSYDESEKRHIWSVGATAEKPSGVADSDLQAYIWPPEVQGINIVIDSKGTLYYYLKRVKDGKETGEVWEFKNDKLVKKMKPGEETRSEESVSDFKQEKTASGVRVKFARNKKAQALAIVQPISMAAGEKFKVYGPMVRGGKTIIKTGTSDGKYVRKPDGAYVMEERNAVNYVLSPDGELTGKISGNLPFDITAFDKELNGYALKTGPAGLTVTKYQLTGVAK